jgi:hypothetical protein
LKTDFENYSDEEIYNYLIDIKPDDHFDQHKWNYLCLELFRRLLKGKVDQEKLTKEIDF